MKLRLLVLAISATVGGCSLIPDYHRPAAPVPTQFSSAPGAEQEEPAQAADASTEAVFSDPALRQLVTLALHNNRDLRVAMLNVDAYRAQYHIQRAALLPAVNANASGSRERMPADLSNTGQADISSNYSANLGISAYELDLFGRVRSLSQEAFEGYMASVESQRTAEIALTSSVANAYLIWVADREQLKLAEDTLQTYTQSLELTASSNTVGVTSALDVSRARTSVEGARASATRYQRLVAQDENALVTLLGTQVPSNLPAIPLAKIYITQLPAGLPSQLLEERPDILEAEHRLKAANADVGAARAAFFPQITLTAEAGTASRDLDDLFKGGASSWYFSPSISLPIFNTGSLKASLDYSRVQKEINVANYEKVIQTAFQEVSDGLAARATYAQQVQAQSDLVAASQAYYHLAERRFRIGLDSSLPLLDAQRSLFSAQQSLIDYRLAQRAAEVSVYVALGGRWHIKAHREVQQQLNTGTGRVVLRR
ncbi:MULTISPECIES: efflux transporter outer membrane subunit [Pseudomonas]|uniref:efflux transporter outer membrane subunit n=1 Tax=Pseudomonas TaxID=286 RepID=UPI003809CDD8